MRKGHFWICQKAPVETITGLDCSAEAVRKAEKRLSFVKTDPSTDASLVSKATVPHFCTPAGGLPRTRAEVLIGNIAEKAAHPGNPEFFCLFGILMTS